MSFWRHGGRSRGIHYQSKLADVLETRPLTARAKSRIARQRIEVGLPLSKIVNVRKEVFGELKVSPSTDELQSCAVLMTDIQQSRITVR